MKSRIKMWSIAGMLLAAVAMPAGMVAQDNASPNHHRHHTYQLIDLGTFGGPNSYPITVDSVLTLSQNGAVAGCAETTEPNPKYPNFNPALFPPPQPDPLTVHAFQSHAGSLTDLGALPGTNSSCALWISGNGLVAGASENGVIDPLTGWPELQAVLWKNQHLINLGGLGGNESVTISVNNRGQVVGAATNNVPEDNGFGDQLRAFLWEHGVMRDLGTLPGGTDAFAIVVNERGQVMGASTTTGGAFHGFLWENGRMRDIPNSIGGTQLNMFYMNNQTMILGNASIAGDLAFHPFFWYRGVMTDIGTFGGDNGDAVWVNETGQVVGSADFPGDFVHHALLWQHGTKADLGTVNGDLCSRAFAINSSSQIVGTSSDCVTAKSAVLWENGTALDLNQLVESDSGLTLIRAWNINERGEIVGEALLDNGDEHAFLLIPHGDCDSHCENRIAAGQSDTMAAQNQAIATQSGKSLVSPSERIRSMMRYRLGAPGPRPLQRD
jgi:probable HAF family extracellular repeat protein